METPEIFKAAIAEAAANVDHGIAVSSDDSSSDLRDHASNAQAARQAAESAFKAQADQISEQYGVAVIWDKPRVGRRRTRAEYVFWKRPVIGFIEFPETLDLGPAALARRYGAAEQNFAVTADTMRAPLSSAARKEARSLLKARGFSVRLPSNFSIRDVQLALKDRRDRAAGVQKFNPKVEIVGDKVYCSGKAFKVAKTGSGKLRIRAGGGWLPLSALIAFLSASE